jgi:hypothetical protein
MSQQCSLNTRNHFTNIRNRSSRHATSPFRSLPVRSMSDHALYDGSVWAALFGSACLRSVELYNFARAQRPDLCF